MNFRGILSKSSLRSSSSGKSFTHIDVSNLQREIETLKQTIDSLKVSVESRDAAIGTLAREKEKIYVELKSVQRTNRNLHQQLVDERDIHSKEKDFLIDEITRLSKHNENYMELQENENSHEDPSKLFEDLKMKDEVIYNIGAKYMKIKSTKIALQKKFEKLQALNKKMCEKIFFLLQDNRKSLDNLLHNLITCSTVSPNSQKYLNLLQINGNLHYENTQLKIYLSTKSSTEIYYQEPNNNVQKSFDQFCSLDNHFKAVEISDNRMRRPGDPYHTVHSKLKSLNKEEHRSFEHMHRTFAPFSRNKFQRSASDSHIIRRGLSELLK